MVGPMELTIFEPEIYNAISGPGSKCIKSDWYEMLHPMVALNSIRERAGYAPRRKVWDQALQSAGKIAFILESWCCLSRLMSGY